MTDDQLKHLMAAIIYSGFKSSSKDFPFRNVDTTEQDIADISMEIALYFLGKRIWLRDNL